MVQELVDAIRSLANGNAAGLVRVPVELFKITLDGDPALRKTARHRCRPLKGREVPQQMERYHHQSTKRIKIFHENEDLAERPTTGVSYR